MGKYAVRAGVDNHVCTLFAGQIPHLGGPVDEPEDDHMVLIGNAPAARAGDKCLCGGVDELVEIKGGSASVLIGNMPAARITDKSAHGGTLQPGCPTVRIGDDPQTASFRSTSAPLVQPCEDPTAPLMV